MPMPPHSTQGIQAVGRPLATNHSLTLKHIKYEITFLGIIPYQNGRTYP